MGRTERGAELGPEVKQRKRGHSGATVSFRDAEIGPQCRASRRELQINRLLALLLVAAALLPHAATARGRRPSRLTIVTYNVLSTPHHPSRPPALLRLLGGSGADLIALQEVRPWFVRAVAGQRWARAYHTTSRSAPGGLWLLSRLPLRRETFTRLPSRHGRGVLIAEVALGRQRLHVAVVHLDSLLPDGARRARQLRRVVQLLRRARHALLVGDFNFGDGDRPESAQLPRRYLDVWRRLRPRDPGLTWDRRRNPLARRNSLPGEPSRRLDRVLLRSAVWRPRAVRIVGDRPVSRRWPRVFPSDHFGVLATLSR